MKQQFMIGVVDTIRLSVYDNNRPSIPTSATITLYKPDGSVLQASASATVNATTGEMTYAISAVHTAEADLNYKAVWAYVVSTVTYYQTQLFDVVKSLLSIPITDDDLYNELESLRKANHQVNDVATAGGAITLTDTKRNEPDNFWKGGTIKLTAGTGVGQLRDISSFVQSTGVFTVSLTWATNPDNTTRYTAVRSWTAKIQSAFDTLCTALYDKGKRHQLILESTQISKPLIYLTIHMICLDLLDDENDRWDRLAKVYQDKYDKAFNSMTLDYDEDDSGTIAGEENQSKPFSIRVDRC